MSLRIINLSLLCRIWALVLIEIVVASVLPPRICLTFGSKKNDWNSNSCLVRDSAFSIQPVRDVPCASISPFSILSAAWVWFPDGRLRGTNGLCLKYQPKSLAEPSIQSELVAAECTQRNDDANEIWTVREGKLWSESMMNDSRVSDESDESTWRQNNVYLEKFNETNLISLQHNTLKAAVASSRQRFRQMSRDVPDVSRGLAELTTALQTAEGESDEVNKLLQNITTLAGEIKADLMGHPTHIGQGVSVEVLESAAAQQPSLTFLSPKFELSADQLRSVGINPSGPVTVRLSGYAIPPKNGLYSFIAKDLTSQLRLTANGVTVIDQWSAPAMGSVKSNPALTLNQGDEVQLVATTSGILGIPNFKLLWQATDSSPPEEIPTSDLYPSIVEPLCTAGGLLAKIDCGTTFNKVKFGAEPVKVNCPPGCLAKTPVPKIFGTPSCYALHSSVCVAAIHSGVSGERGGFVLLQINPSIAKAQYPGVEGFQSSSGESPAGTGCASVTMALPGGGPTGLQDVTLEDKADIVSSDGSGSLSGMYGALTSFDRSILARKGWGPGFLSHIAVSCGSSGYQFDKNAFDKSLELIDGSTILLKNADSVNDMSVNDVYVAVDQGAPPVLFPSRNGWNRLTCQTVKNKINLYFKFSTPSEEYQYPSATLSCEDKFESLTSPLQSFSVRCPRFCFKSFAPVSGLFTYSGGSSVCRSALHAGVIAEAGGTVQITRHPAVGPVTWSSKRNGITSTTDESPGPLFMVDVPAGRKCVYPEHPGGLSHISMASPKFEAASSFLQVSQQGRPIQLHSHNKDTILPPSFRQASSNRLFDISIFKSGAVKGVEDIKQSFESIAERQLEKTKDLENGRQAVSMMETLIREKLNQREAKINSLERELIELEAESADPFIDYDRAASIYENWLVIDGVDSQLGPSFWSIGPVKDSGRSVLSQSSSIASKNGLGTAVVLKGRSFDKGFMAARVQIAEGGYGTFGFIVKYLSDDEYVALELSRPSVGGSGSVAFRRVKNRVWGLPEGQVAFDVPSGWLSLGVEFGRSGARAFVNGGALKTGINLDTPIKGGTVGLMTNALGTDAMVSFDSISVGPLESQYIIAKDFFGPEAERKDSVRVELVGAREQEQASPIEGVSTSGAAVLPSIQPPTSSPPSFPTNVNATLGPNGCLRFYSDPLASELETGWTIPPAPASWTLASGTGEHKFVVATLDPRTSSALYLSRNGCQEGTGIKLSTFLRIHNNAKGGIVFRAASPTTYLAALADFTEHGPQVSLIDVRDKSSREFATSTAAKLKPDVWYEMQVEDLGNLVRVSLDNVVILQIKVPIGAEGSQGLVAENGVADFRNFLFSVLYD